MPLSEQHRQRLDSIVQQMIDADEDDSTIRAVVQDFKGKYETADSGLVPAAGVLAGTAPTVPGVIRLVEEVATSPKIGMVAAQAKKYLRPLNAGEAAVGVLTGRKSAGQAATDAIRNEAIIRTPSVIQRLALRGAPALEGVTGISAAGALLGAALPVGFLGLLERDVNRDTSQIGKGDSLADQIARALLARGR